MIRYTHMQQMPNPIKIELFIRERNLNIFLFLLCNHFVLCPKVFYYIRPHSTNLFVLILWSKWEFQKITNNCPSNIDFKYFIKFYKNWTIKPYFFFVNDTMLPSNNHFHLRCNRSQKNIEKSQDSWWKG